MLYSNVNIFWRVEFVTVQWHHFIPYKQKFGANSDIANPIFLDDLKRPICGDSLYLSLLDCIMFAIRNRSGLVQRKVLVTLYNKLCTSKIAFLKTQKVPIHEIQYWGNARRLNLSILKVAKNNVFLAKFLLLF